MVGASFKSDVFDSASHAWEFMLDAGKGDSNIVWRVPRHLHFKILPFFFAFSLFVEKTVHSCLFGISCGHFVGIYCIHVCVCVCVYLPNQYDLISSVNCGIGDMPLQAHGPFSELTLNTLRHRYILLWERYQSASSPIRVHTHIHVRAHTCAHTHTRTRKKDEITIILRQLISYFLIEEGTSPYLLLFSFFSLQPISGLYSRNILQISFVIFSCLFPFFHLFMWCLPSQNRLPCLHL